MLKQIAVPVFLLMAVTCFAQDKEYAETSLPELMKKVQQGGKGFMILDVRSNGEYMDTISGGRQAGIGRIKGAINISIQDLEQKPEAIQQLEKYKQEDIYVICSHSYRSRRVTALLQQNGFTKVINVKGGMSEWYRNYDELAAYRDGSYENNIAYHNIAPAELYKKLAAKEPVEFIGLNGAPRSFFDSLVMDFYPAFPDFKKASYFKPGDSLGVLEKVKAAGGKPVVLFSKIGGGLLDMLLWLAQKGFTNIYNVVGGLNGFYEYLVNYQSANAPQKYMAINSAIQFYTPLSFCQSPPRLVQWIDLRHDTTFNQLTQGTRLDYKTLKGAVNFPFYKTADAFMNQFPDKKTYYMIIPQDGYNGVALVNELLKKGYRIGWLIGGIERWEWYTNNIVEFTCKDQFVK